MEGGSQSFNSILEKFEKQIAECVGTRYAIACSSARAAIRFSLLALKIGRGDEVLVPDLACEILPITILCTGALPRFCDIDKSTLGLSPTHMMKVLTSETKAVIFVHPHGIPVDPWSISEIARKRGVALIDDAAQSLGTSLKGKKAGSFGDVGILSFNKWLNVSLGGAAVTDDEEIAAKIRLFRTRYEDKPLLLSLSHRIMEYLGLTFDRLLKMTFLCDNHLFELLHGTRRYATGLWLTNPDAIELTNAKPISRTVANQLLAYGGAYWHRRSLTKLEISLLSSELENIEKYLVKRRRVALIYDECLTEEGVKKPVIPSDSTPSYLRYPVLVLSEKKCLKCLKDLTDAGHQIDYRYRPLHMFPSLNWTCERQTFENSTYASKHILPLPTGLDMNIEEIDEVVSIVNSN